MKQQADHNSYCMKKTILIITFSFIYISCLSQDRIWGVSSGGMGAGLIYSINTDGTNFKIVKNFDLEAGRPDSFIEGNDGFLYGIAKIGGNDNGGRIIKVKKDGTTYYSIYDFLKGETGIKKLLKYNDYLIGTVSNAGNSNLGYIFSLKTDGSTFKVIHHFTEDGTLLKNPFFLLKASDGFFYGLAGGGRSGYGTIFRFDLVNQSIQKIYDVDPWGGYGFNDIFEGKDGYLYGTTSDGFAEVSSGSVFRISKTGTNFKVLHGFSSDFGGKTPLSSLVQTPSGQLIGTYNFGGALGRGGIFSIESNGTNYQVLYSFSNEGGQSPTGNLLIDDKYVYGVTAQDGFNLSGASTIFRIKFDGTSYETMANTKSGAQLISKSDTIFYTMEYGGLGNFGAINSMVIQNKTNSVVIDFNPINGADPNSKLVQHSNGFLYGTTLSGGKFGEGILYRINPKNDTFESLYQFQSRKSLYSIFERDNGKLIALNFENLNSEVLEIDTKSNEPIVRYTYSNKYLQDLIQTPTGDFVGTVEIPYKDNSELIRLDSSFQSIKVTNTELKLRQPLSLIQFDTICKVFGASEGSVSNKSIIYTFDFKNGAINQHYKFDDYTNSPIGKLVSDKEGSIIGLTNRTIFTINPDGSSNSTYQLPSYVPFIGGLTQAAESDFFALSYYFHPSGSNGTIFKYNYNDGLSAIKNLDTSIITFIQSGLSLSREKFGSLRIFGNLNFVTTELDKTTKKQIKLKNFGNDELLVSGIILPESFSTPISKFKLNPGEVKVLEVSFTPSAEKTYEGTVSIISNSIDNFNKIRAFGKGILITAIENQNQISIYPIPTQSNLIVESRERIKSLSISTIVGEPIPAGIFTTTENSKSFDLSGFPDGIYYLTIETELHSFRRKIIKI